MPATRQVILEEKYSQLNNLVESALVSQDVTKDFDEIREQVLSEIEDLIYIFLGLSDKVLPQEENLSDLFDKMEEILNFLIDKSHIQPLSGDTSFEDIQKVAEHDYWEILRKVQSLKQVFVAQE